jgi:hypothetical protein
MDDLGLVRTVDRTGQGVIIATADTAQRRLDPGLGKAFCILDRDVLAAAVAVDQLTAMGRSLIVDRLLEGVEHEARMCRPAHPPARIRNRLAAG